MPILLLLQVFPLQLVELLLTPQPISLILFSPPRVFLLPLTVLIQLVYQLLPAPPNPPISTPPPIFATPRVRRSTRQGKHHRL